jgi:hypothetical protein
VEELVLNLNGVLPATKRKNTAIWLEEKNKYWYMRFDPTAGEFRTRRRAAQGLGTVRRAPGASCFFAFDF